MPAELRVLRGQHGANKVYWLAAPDPQAAVVFFVGDQLEAADLPAEVVRLQDPRTQAAMLARRFPGASVAVVMPSRLEAGRSCFDHFLGPVTRIGEPLGYRPAGAKASSQIASLLRAGGLDFSGSSLERCHLVGFSRGGVVLNQVMTELAYCASQTAPDAECRAAADFMQAVAEVHYADVGLNCRGAYVTDPGLAPGLAALARRQPELHIHLHGTPRQWDDANRSWICIEKNRYKDLLLTAGVPVHEHKYFEGQPPSLLQHFQCLEAMTQEVSDVQSCQAAPK